MENIARLLVSSGLDKADRSRLEVLKGKGQAWIVDGETRIYRSSLHLRDSVLYFVASEGTEKHLYLASERPLPRMFQGPTVKLEGLHLLEADLSPENAKHLHEMFPFTAPVSLRDKKTTIGCGDRLGLATPGHVRAAAKYDVSPVLAQQSIRELALTRRDYPGVVADATFLVFQEGYDRGYGADGDHLKTIKDIDVALAARMPMITLDLTEVMSPEPASWDAVRISAEFGKLDAGTRRRVRDEYAGRTFALAGADITFAPSEAERCALMYGRALDFSRDVDRHLKEKRGNGYDLEISIDETTAPTLPAHHFFIAAELARRGVAVNSLAPRFVGEFQKGIDYIGDTAEFERQFEVHCAIARRYGGYKVSIHSGSDKFSVYPAIGRHTGMRLHLKTAGTSWLEAVRVIARTNPALFREMLGKAFASFEEATKLYYVTTNLGAIPDVQACADSGLAGYLDAKDSRQLLHITYGGLLSDPEIRTGLFQTLARNEETHYAAVEKHMDKHLRLLGVREYPFGGYAVPTRVE
ncbi:MAG TPA: tagaturonate epimerase family protein [Spirochaetia bacterium]|nr:tagaturonate epimerase family protein [Spirochaetia bacterium]